MLNWTNLKHSSTDWKRINMRNVEHLLGVEFMHDLYNRHEPSINSIRFRHTITVWKNKIVNSYAPQKEWDQIGDIIGMKFYSLDKDIISNTVRLFNRERTTYTKFIKKIKTIDLSKTSDVDLSMLLVDFQSIVLGDLYVLNLVQIEHGLNLAVLRVLNEIVSDKNTIDSILSQLIQTDVPTQSQVEANNLYLLAKFYGFIKAIHFDSFVTKENLLKWHHRKKAYLYSAYGEMPRDFKVFENKFDDYINNRRSNEHRFILFPAVISRLSKKLLNHFSNNKLDILIPLLVRGGIFRDINKSLLGYSMRYRFGILDEISRRGLESRDNLNYYLLSEIVELLTKNIKLDSKILSDRRDFGVILTRDEDITIYDKSEVPSIDKGNLCKVLHGQCASRGTCTGKCKIVLTKEDSSKVNDGDIMIAVGTDFDLIEAMYRSSAVITEESGILSHAAVVCRELSKPCCIGVKDVTKLVSDGQKVRLDATSGNLYIE